MNRGINEKILLSQVSLPLKIENFSVQVFGAKAEAHFLKRKESLDLFTYSLLRVRDCDLAYELYLQIEAAESEFSTVANKHSEGKERFSGGIIGPTTLANAHPLLRNHLSKSSIGVIKEPFNVDSFWIVTRLEAFRPAKFDNKMKQRMCIELFDSLIEEKSNKLLSTVLTQTFKTSSV